MTSYHSGCIYHFFYHVFIIYLATHVPVKGGDILSFWMYLSFFFYRVFIIYLATHVPVKGGDIFYHSGCIYHLFIIYISCTYHLFSYSRSSQGR